jgi:hypothetical protein
VPKKNGWRLGELERILGESDRIWFVKSIGISGSLDECTNAMAIDMDMMDNPATTNDAFRLESARNVATSVNSATRMISAVISPLACNPPSDRQTDPQFLHLLTAQPGQHVSRVRVKKHPARPKEFFFWLQCQQEWPLLEQKLGAEKIKSLIL